MDINAAFKLFDIRGAYPTEVDEKLAFLVGKGLNLLYRPYRVVVASDTRESSPMLRKFLKDGFNERDVEIFDLYEAPIPQFYFTVASGDYDLGVMVTASHVDDYKNGFKIVGPDGFPLDQKEILNLKNIVNQIENDPITPTVKSFRINTTHDYIDAILNLIGDKKFSSKVCVDITHSTVVTPVLVLFSRLGINFTLVKSNRSSNPLLLENQSDLAKTVVETGADLGIMWDSDGDRVVFLDRHGKMIPTSFIIGCMGKRFVEEKSGGRVAIDVRAGLVVRDLVRPAGGEIEVFPAWSQYIKYAMREDPQLIFGGEVSGHFTFRDFYCIDDGILAALRFLELWEEENIESLLQSLAKRYFELPEKNFPCSPERAAEVLNKITNLYRQKNYLVSVEDGLTVFGEDFKFNLRPSLTESLLRLNLEAKTQEEADKIVENLENCLLEYA